MQVCEKLAQALLAVITLASTIATYIALSPPNANTEKTSSVEDSLSSLGVTNSSFRKLALSPLFLLSLHTSILNLLYPDLPPWLLRYGKLNGLNSRLVTWSLSTVVPLSLLFAGVLLRLIPYATLGQNFTFFLSSPDHLVTTGIYSYMQHPSYVGLFILVLSNNMLLGRPDGVICCWLPPKWYAPVTRLATGLLGSAGVPILLFGIWTRVIEEEKLLNREFGEEWKMWHNRTARFIPGVF